MAVTVRTQRVGQSEKIRGPLVFGREVPIVVIMFEVPIIVVRVKDWDGVVSVTEAVPKGPVELGNVLVMVPVEIVPVPDSVPARG